MSRILIDTNAYTALLGGNREIASILAQSEAVLLSPIVIGELLDGFSKGNRNRENTELFERFRAKPRTVSVPITDDTADWFALIKRQLRQKGRPLPMHDVWIAASCMEHGAKFLTFDEHFSEIEGLLRYP